MMSTVNCPWLAIGILDRGDMMVTIFRKPTFFRNTLYINTTMEILRINESKCNFPMNPNVRLLVGFLDGRTVGWYVIIS